MSLYPEIEPFNQFTLPVGELHQLHVEQCGHPRGMPVLVVHGGPGGGCSPLQRRYFDPARWHIILFDQRGAGRSTPLAETRENTTADLIEDMERIRSALGITRWVLFGGSWGVTLSLAYAQSHPDKVAGMVLRGVFLGRQEDLAWLYGKSGAARLQPEAWSEFVGPLNDVEREDPLAAYHRRLNADDEQDALALVQRWAAWEAACSTLQPSAAVSQGFARQALAIARIETHYFAGGGFAGYDLLDAMGVMAAIPGIIVHGRYDLVCPVDQALALHRRWPASALRVVAAAGHSMLEPGIEQAVMQAIAEMALRLTEASQQ